MSLFPAYKATNAVESITNQPDTSWLTNSSFKIDLGSISEKDNDAKVPKKKKKKHKKHKKEKSEKESTSIPIVEECELNSQKESNFEINRKPEYGNLNVKTISWPAVSKYRIDRYFTVKTKKKNKQLRYFSKNFDELNNKEQLDDNLVNQFERHDESVISNYNRNLNKNPFDVTLWLEFVSYQDTIWRYEKVYRRGSNAKTSRIIAERKLSILDKAIVHNPKNEDLMRERVKVAERVYPADELHIMMKQLVDKDKTNIIFWQGLIESKQCSMAYCNITTIFELYNQCLSQLHQSRRKTNMESGGNVEKIILEEKILTILYQCGLFLRQSGLWEQLWTLLRLYLELNIAIQSQQKGLFKMNPIQIIDENYLIELEETVLSSQLPSHELWLRIEKLRESYHWMPCSATENQSLIADPQRIVFSDDVSDLIHPITSDNNVFKLNIIILTLLKLPLLPYRHEKVKQLGLINVPWAYDSIEMLLPILLPIYHHGKHFETNSILEGSIKLTVGPQYLRTHPGQEEYLNFLLDIVKSCGNCFMNNKQEQIAINLWWLRFERLLIVLERLTYCKIHYKSATKNSRKKILKNDLKIFFRQECNRNNFLYFTEMALIEYENGDFESAIKIFKNNIQFFLQKYQNSTDITEVSDELDKSFICYLIRSFIEILIGENQLKEAIQYLIILTSFNHSLKKDTETIIEVQNETLMKFDELLHTLLNNNEHQQDNINLVTYFLPDFFTEWTLCYCWFLYLTKSVYDAGVIIEQILNNDSVPVWKKEIFYEFYVFLLFKYCNENPGCGLFPLLNEQLRKSLKLFPNNLFLLNMVSKIEHKSFGFGEPVWTLNNILSESGYSIPAIFLVLLSNERQNKLLNILNSQNNNEYDANTKNRMLSLFQKLTNNNNSVKRCGLIWRLYLQFLYQNCTTEDIKNTYYAAVEKCPWLKALYIDAAVYIPNQLSQIQDLIVEKELRIHLAPDELEVLRN